MDGNYSRCFPQRLARATGLILLDTPTAVSLLRYVRRCWFETERLGGLAGGRDSVKWSMIRHIAIATRANRRRYEEIFDGLGLPRIRLSSPAALAAFYRSNGLSR
jgi:adenylate kinase family enzyme